MLQSTSGKSRRSRLRRMIARTVMVARAREAMEVGEIGQAEAIADMLLIMAQTAKVMVEEVTEVAGAGEEQGGEAMIMIDEI